MPLGGEVYLLNRIIGYKKALNLFFFEKEVSAKDALSMDLVDDIVSSGQLEDAAFRMADEISKKPSYILSAIKGLTCRAPKGLEESLAHEKRLYSTVVNSNEFKETVKVCSIDL